MINMSKMAAATKTLMGRRTPMIHKNTAPVSVDSRTDKTIWRASSILAYSHKLLYSLNTAIKATFTRARIPNMK